VFETLQALYADTVEQLAAMVVKAQVPTKSGRNRLAQSVRAMSQHTEAVLQQLRVDLTEMEQEAQKDMDCENLSNLQSARKRTKRLSDWTKVRHPTRPSTLLHCICWD
jgi:Skp family chaperone for outer membrane proteins